MRKKLGWSDVSLPVQILRAFMEAQKVVYYQ
jgi:hypothetical protein